MSLYDKVTSVIAKIGLWFIGISYAVMTIVTLIEVLRRYFFGLSFGWAEELVRFLLVTSTFIGGAVAYHKGSLVLFDALLNRLSERNAHILNIINNVIILIFSFVVLRLGINYIMTPAVLLQKSPGLRIPFLIPYMFIPIGFFMVVLFSIGKLWHSCKFVFAKGGRAS